MSPGDANVRAFLAAAGWEGAACAPLAGDASARRYSRLADGRGSAVLMEDPGGDVGRFAALAGHLLGLGLSAPRILARDDRAGLLLLEDLGDGLFARLATAAPGREAELYAAAAEAQAVLHRHDPAPGLVRAAPQHLAAMTDLAFDWYCPRATGERPRAEACRAAMQALDEALERHAARCDVTVLRDFHAENLLWLPDRAGAARAGLLDFQDALAGHRAYDLVSLLQDARRDVAPATAEATIRRYLDAAGGEAAPFEAAMAVLGAQRNLRILGVFARLAARDGKTRYIDLVPRVWRHLEADLAHPALAGLAPRLAALLPPPGPAVLNALRTPCPTPCPTP
ncbi:aminoglycoside phosphotransferase family protein [Roseivivax sp. CAU 1761]